MQNVHKRFREIGGSILRKRICKEGECGEQARGGSVRLCSVVAASHRVVVSFVAEFLYLPQSVGVSLPFSSGSL